MNLPLPSIKRRLCLGLFASLLLSACTSLSPLKGSDTRSIVPEVNARRYVEHQSTHGVVLLDAKWDRRWKCSGFENARLSAFGFDRLPLSKRSADEPADAMLAHRPSLLSDRAQGFQPYALLLEPGEYALSGFLIRVAVSTKDIRYIQTERAELLRDGFPRGGTFKVAAGETVYIGNFFLDCALSRPILWRYYTEKAQWLEHLNEYKTKYPFLDLSDVRYRLFDTEVFGSP